MTVVIDMHKTSFIFMTCHVMVLKVSCQSYAHPFKSSVTQTDKKINTFLFNFIQWNKTGY